MTVDLFATAVESFPNIFGIVLCSCKYTELKLDHGMLHCMVKLLLPLVEDERRL